MNYEEWVTAEKPNLGDDTALRVKKAMNTTSHLMTLALQVKEETRHAINELLKVTFKLFKYYRNFFKEVVKSNWICELGFDVVFIFRIF